MGQYLILVVDDDESTLFNIRLILEMNNFQVSTAINGRKAIEKLKNDTIIPHLIISDIMMPELNGYEFLKEISLDFRWNTIPFIFLSAKSMPDDIRLGKLLGADDYLTKPVDSELLIGIINRKLSKIKQIEKHIQNTEELRLLRNLKNKFEKSGVHNKKESIFLFMGELDTNGNPLITKQFFNDNHPQIEISSVGILLYNSLFPLFNQENVSTETFLLNLMNVQMKAFIHFEKSSMLNNGDKNEPIMIGILAKKITYYHLLKLKNYFSSFLSEKNLRERIDFSNCFQEVQLILS